MLTAEEKKKKKRSEDADAAEAKMQPMTDEMNTCFPFLAAYEPELAASTCSTVNPLPLPVINKKRGNKELQLVNFCLFFSSSFLSASRFTRSGSHLYSCERRRRRRKNCCLYFLCVRSYYTHWIYDLLKCLRRESQNEHEECTLNEKIRKKRKEK